MPEPAASASPTPHLIVLWQARTLTPRPEPPGGNGLGRACCRTRGWPGIRPAGSGPARPSDTQSYQPDGFAIRVEAAQAQSLALEKFDVSGLTLLSSHPKTEDAPQDVLVWVPFDKVASFAERITAFTQNTAV